MSDSPDPERVREAVGVLRSEFGDPDHLELYYSRYNGDDHVNVHCPDAPAGIKESPDDRYRLEPVDLGETEAWTIRPVDIPRKL